MTDTEKPKNVEIDLAGAEDLAKRLAGGKWVQSDWDQIRLDWDRVVKMGSLIADAIQEDAPTATRKRMQEARKLMREARVEAARRRRNAERLERSRLLRQTADIYILAGHVRVDTGRDLYPGGTPVSVALAHPITKMRLDYRRFTRAIRRAWRAWRTPKLPAPKPVGPYR